MLAYCLNKNVNGESLLKDIQKLIDSKSKDNTTNLVLVIDVREISKESTQHIAKIEYRPLDQ